MVNLSKISENLKELMAEHEISQKELAEKLNTGRTKLSDILGGKNAPNYNTFVALAEYFNCSADFLLGLDDYPHEDVAYAPVRPFCRSLRLLLEQSGTTVYAFQKGTKLSWSVIYGWLNGKTLPSCYNLAKVAAFFGCSADCLLGRR